jgi:hypothetical protein
MTSLLDIRVLCKVGCIVVFDDKTCHVYCKGKTSNLWMLPIGQEKLWTTPASDLEDPSLHKILGTITNATYTAYMNCQGIVSPALQISFPLHCIEPTFTPVTQVKELSEELQQKLATMRCKKHTLATLKTLIDNFNAYIASNLPPQPLQPLEQRVQQRVIDVAPQSFSHILQRVNMPPVTALANNPTPPRKLQTTKWTHKHKSKPIHRVCYHVSQGSTSSNPHPQSYHHKLRDKKTLHH